jgi:hypothetical protein
MKLKAPLQRRRSNNGTFYAPLNEQGHKNTFPRSSRALNKICVTQKRLYINVSRAALAGGAHESWALLFFWQITGQ